AKLALVRNVAYDPEKPDTDECSLGIWWDGLTVRQTVRQGDQEASTINSWMTRRRQDGGYLGGFLTPYMYQRILAKQRMLAPLARWQKGTRFGTEAESAEALLKMAAWDRRMAVYLLGTCTRVLEHNVAKVLKFLVSNEPDIAVALLRDLLAEFPGKCVRLCREVGLSVPPPQWYRQQQLEPPEPQELS
ncbi:MAG: hypothetical protein WAK86_14810, partial [Pseudonocardiaceae bacterium]